MKQETVQIAFRVPKPLADELRKIMDREDRSLAWIANKAVREFVAKEAKK